MNTLSFDLVNHIMTFVHDYKKDYDKVIKYMNCTFHPLCGEFCLYDYKPYLFNDKFYGLPPSLMRYSNKLCEKCEFLHTSYHDLKVCHKCADEVYYPKEFEYYHSVCQFKIKA